MSCWWNHWGKSWSLFYSYKVTATWHFLCVCVFRDMLITDLPATLTFEELCEEVRIMCSVAKQLPITLKWIDDEGGCASMWNTAVHVPCLWPFYMLAKLWLISWSFGLSKFISTSSYCRLEWLRMLLFNTLHSKNLHPWPSPAILWIK